MLCDYVSIRSANVPAGARECCAERASPRVLSEAKTGWQSVEVDLDATSAPLAQAKLELLSL